MDIKQFALFAWLPFLRAGFGGMAGYFGGTLFSLVIGQLASTTGYEPLFICLSVFDIVAFLTVWLVLGRTCLGHRH